MRYLERRLVSLLEGACSLISGNSYSLVFFNSFGILLMGALVSKRHKNGDILDAIFNSLRLEFKLSLSYASRLRSGEDSVE